ncbi:MAG: protein kinase [Planctomycetota bacterium]
MFNELVPFAGSTPRPLGSGPATLGEFEIRSELGRGGMGVVYEAWQPSLRRTVALKVLSRDVSASPSAVQRFQREAQAAAQLQHTHIIPIFAQGEEHGVHFYVMELVDGCSLNTIIAAARDKQANESAAADLGDTIALPRKTVAPSTIQTHSNFSGSGSTVKYSAREWAAIFADSVGACRKQEQFQLAAEQIANVADALQYAHDHGVIHRDIKPHNLMFGGDRRLRISDFGLARMPEHPGVTVTGEMLGSPLYMSPEHILEGPSSVDRRADVYSLGITLYEWLTLKPPYPGETREQVITRIVHTDPIPPRMHNAAIPLDLETIALKAMEKDRARRYQSAGELRDDLRRFLSLRPIKARRTSLTWRARKFIRRHQAASFAAAILLMASVMGVALVNKQGQVRVQREAVRIAERETEKLRVAAQAAKSDRSDSEDTEAQSTKEVVDTLRAQVEESNAKINSLAALFSRVMPAEAGMVLQGARAATPVAQELLRTGQGMSFVAPLIQDDPGAGVADIPGIVRQWLGEYYETIHPPNWPPEEEDVPRTEYSLLLKNAVLWRTSQPKAAAGLLEDFLSLRQEDLAARRLLTALTGQLAQPEKMVENANELVRLQSDSADAYVLRGLANLLIGRMEESLGDLTRASELDRTSAWVKSFRAIALLHSGRSTEALIALNEVARQAPNLLLGLVGRAAAYASTGQFDKAVADITRVLEFRPGDPQALIIRGDAYRETSDYAAALNDFQQAMSTLGQTPALMMRCALCDLLKSKTTGQFKPSLPLPPQGVVVPSPPESVAPKPPTVGPAKTGAHEGRRPSASPVRAYTFP